MKFCYLLSKTNLDKSFQIKQNRFALKYSSTLQSGNEKVIFFISIFAYITPNLKI